MSQLPTRSLSITQGLILSNVAVFLLGAVLPSMPAIFGIPYSRAAETESVLFIRGAYSWYTCFMEGELWRLISYQFLHAGVIHILFNMWVLYQFGPLVEERFGPKRYLVFYLACGVAGALFSSLLAGLGFFYSAVDPVQLAYTTNALATYTGTPGLEFWQLVPMVGASAGIFGVLVAVAYMYPYMRITLLIPPVTLTMRTFALLILAFAVVTVLTNGNNAGGEAGHLGGIILAAIIMTIWRMRHSSRDWHDNTF